MSLTNTLTEEEEEEEDTELRDLVTNVLKQKGVLGRMKAELRSNVYLSLDGGNQLRPARGGDPTKSGGGSALETFLSGSSDARLLLQLVREFLAFFNLKFTLSVFDPEANIDDTQQCKSRDQLIEGLGLGETLNRSSGNKVPILAEILRLSKVSILKSETPTPTDRTEDESSMPSSLDSATVPATSSTTHSKPNTDNSRKRINAAGDVSGEDGFGTAATDKSLILDKPSSQAVASSPSISSSSSNTAQIDSIAKPVGEVLGSRRATEGISSPIGSVKPNTASSLSPLGGSSSSGGAGGNGGAQTPGNTSQTSGSLDSTFILNKTPDKELSASATFTKTPVATPSSLQQTLSSTTKTAPRTTTPVASSSLSSSSKPPSSVPPPSKTPSSSASSLGDLPKLGSPSSSLGNLPPLGALGGGGGSPASSKKTLAPLKKLDPLKKEPSPEGSTSKPKASEPSQTSSEKKSPAATKTAPAAAELTTTNAGAKNTVSTLSLLGKNVSQKPSEDKTEDPSTKEELSVEEDIDEDLDEFLDSSISGAEGDLTKDETASEAASMRADYKEKLKE